jgi:hypothetical protein
MEKKDKDIKEQEKEDSDYEVEEEKKGDNGNIFNPETTTEDKIN